MIEERTNAWVVRVYVKEQSKYRYGGSFSFKKWGGKRKAKEAARIANDRLEDQIVRERFGALTGVKTVPTCREWATRHMDVRRERGKASSYETLRSSLKPFIADFGDRPLNAVGRLEADNWCRKVKPHNIPPVIALYNEAIDKLDGAVESNPFRGLARRSEGRGRQHPPAREEMAKLMDACSVHKHYAQKFRAFFTFAAYTAMRPGEICALEWRDIDFERNRINIRRRDYKGVLDTPKTGVRQCSLTPPARDAILGLPRTSSHVFLSKNDKPMRVGTVNTYWRRVLDTAGLDFDFYLATRHWCAHYLWVELGIDKDDVIEQVGHVDTKLLEEVYGHRNIGALDRINAAFERNVIPGKFGVRSAKGA